MSNSVTASLLLGISTVQTFKSYQMMYAVHGVTANPLLGISTMQTFKSYQMMYCTWCHRKPTTWYLHHANLQILSDGVRYTLHGVTANPLPGNSTMQTFKSYQKSTIQRNLQSLVAGEQSRLKGMLFSQVPEELLHFFKPTWGQNRISARKHCNPDQWTLCTSHLITCTAWQ